MLKRIIDKFREQRGSTNALGLILTLPILMVILFGGVDYWLMNSQFTKLEYMKNHYLDRARLQGCLTADDISELNTEITNMGFSVSEISIEEANPIDPDNPVKYTEEDRAIRKIAIDSINDIPELRLTIKGEFQKGKFWVADLMSGLYGTEKKEEENTGGLPFKIEGTTFTEYVERS